MHSTRGGRLGWTLLRTAVSVVLLVLILRKVTAAELVEHIARQVQPANQKALEHLAAGKRASVIPVPRFLSNRPDRLILASRRN